MGNGLEPVQDEPTAVEFTKHLLKESSEESIDNPKTITEWCEFVGRRGSNNTAREYFDSLIDLGVLVEKGRKPSGNEVVPIYGLENRERLLKAFYNTDYYEAHRDLFIEVMRRFEPKIKVDKVISLFK